MRIKSVTVPYDLSRNIHDQCPLHDAQNAQNVQDPCPYVRWLAGWSVGRLLSAPESRDTWGEIAPGRPVPSASGAQIHTYTNTIYIIIHFVFRPSELPTRDVMTKRRRLPWVMLDWNNFGWSGAKRKTMVLNLEDTGPLNKFLRK